MFSNCFDLSSSFVQSNADTTEAVLDDDRRRRLMSAIERGDVDEVGAALDDGNFDIDVCYPVYWQHARHAIEYSLDCRRSNSLSKQTALLTPLQFAAHIRGDRIDIVSTLLLLLLANKSAHSLERAESQSGETALHFAVSMGNTRVAIGLLDAGTNIDARTKSQRSALHLAAFNGHCDALAELLRRGASIEARNRFGETPIHSAAASSSVECIRLLACAGATVDVRNGQGASALRTAACRDVVCAQQLLIGGATLLLDRHKSVEALRHAAVHRRLDAVKVLASRADIASLPIDDAATASYQRAVAAALGAVQRRRRIAMATCGGGSSLLLRCYDAALRHRLDMMHTLPVPTLDLCMRRELELNESVQLDDHELETLASAPWQVKGFEARC
jgi:Ankyrin repeats (3 copies)